MKPRPSSLGPHHHLRAFATETTSELDIFALDCHTFGVDGAEVGIFEQADQVGLD